MIKPKHNEWGINKVLIDKNEIKRILRKSQDVKWIFNSNPTSISNTSLINKAFKNFKDIKQNYFNDDLISIVEESLCEEKIYLNYPFYVHNFRFGQTSKINAEKEKSFKHLFVNLQNILIVFETDFTNVKSNSNKVKKYVKRRYKRELNNLNPNYRLDIINIFKIIDNLWE